MEIVTEPRTAQQAIVKVSGRFDAETCQTLRLHLVELASHDVNRVTLDLSGVSFLDSSGLSVLVASLKSLRQAGGGLNLAAARPQARTALRLTLLDTILPIFDTVDEAAIALAR
mgnify:CR=1 FL=1